VAIPVSIVLAVMYVTLKQDISVDEPVWHYYISLDCNQIQKNIFMFADVEIVNAAYQFCVVGAYLGMIIDAKKNRGTAQYAHDTSAGKATLRMLITLAILIPVFTFCAIESQVYNKNPVKNGMVYRAFFLIAMPTLFFSFLFYGWGNLMFKKCKLIRERARQPKRSITASDVDPMLNYEEVTDYNESGTDILEFD